MNSVFDPHTQELNIESKIVVALDRISEAFKVRLWNENKKYGLSPIQLQIITFLLFHPDEVRTVSRLAKEFSTTKSSISDSIKALEKKNYIIRKKILVDFRVSTINLTEEGKIVALDVSSFASHIEKIVIGIEDSKKEVLLDSLVEIIHKLFVDKLINPQRICLTCRYHKKIPGENLYTCTMLNKHMEESDLRINCMEYK